MFLPWVYCEPCPNIRFVKETNCAAGPALSASFDAWLALVWSIKGTCLVGFSLFPTGRSFPPQPSSSIPKIADNQPSGAEIAVGIICGCMPVLPQFLRHFVPLIKTRLNSYRRAKSGAPSNNDVSAAAAPWVDRYNESRRLRGMGLGMTDFSVDTTLRTMPGQREPSVMTVHDEESVMDAEDPKSIPLHRLKSVHEVESVRHPEQVLDRDLVLSVGSPDSVEGPRIDGSDKRGK